HDAIVASAPASGVRARWARTRPAFRTRSPHAPVPVLRVSEQRLEPARRHDLQLVVTDRQPVATGRRGPGSSARTARRPAWRCLCTRAWRELTPTANDEETMTQKHLRGFAL